MLNQERQWVIQSAAALHNENERFRKYLINSSSPTQLDNWFQEIGQFVASQIDCTLCAACCMSLEPAISENELTLLNQYKPANTIRVQVEDHDRIYLKSPCCYLKGNLCSVYTDRPAACKGHPHLDAPGIRYRLRTVFSQASVCPIVLHTIQKLKAETGFLNT